MTELEKMYENANAYKTLCNCSFKNLFNYSIDYGQDACLYAEDEIRQGCKSCELAEQNVKYYPPFTAEKQLDIIKLISKQGQIIIENWEKDNRGFNVTFRANSNLRYITMDCITRKTIEETLAQIINDIWQDLTDQEKEEIRRILNE